MLDLILAAVCTLAVIVAAWVVYEAVTAAVLDENGNVVEDRWGRL